MYIMMDCTSKNCLRLEDKMHIKYPAQWPSHLSALYKLALNIIIHVLCIPCCSWLSLRCGVKQNLSNVCMKLSRIWSGESSYWKHFHYGFVSHLGPYLTIVLVLDMVDVTLMMNTKYNIFIF